MTRNNKINIQTFNWIIPNIYFHFSFPSHSIPRIGSHTCTQTYDTGHTTQDKNTWNRIEICLYVCWHIWACLTMTHFGRKDKKNIEKKIRPLYAYLFNFWQIPICKSYKRTEMPKTYISVWVQLSPTHHIPSKIW